MSQLIEMAVRIDLHVLQSIEMAVRMNITVLQFLEKAVRRDIQCHRVNRDFQVRYNCVTVNRDRLRRDITVSQS